MLDYHLFAMIKYCPAAFKAIFFCRKLPAEFEYNQSFLELLFILVTAYSAYVRLAPFLP